MQLSLQHYYKFKEMPRQIKVKNVGFSSKYAGKLNSLPFLDVVLSVALVSAVQFLSDI